MAGRTSDKDRPGGHEDDDRSGGVDSGPSEFESGLDYAAFVEDDGDTDEIPASGSHSATGPTGARPQVDPGTDSTQTLDRREIDRLVGADTSGDGRAGVVTATAAPEPTSARAAGPASAPAATSAAAVRDAEARAAARDEALGGSATTPRLLQVLLAVFFPIVVLIAAVRLVASPLFLWLEYHRPGFPADPHGFSTEDRLTYGSAGLDYLFNLAPPRYLGDLQHDGAPLFMDTEVSHMADVKLVMLITMAVGVVLGLLCIAFMVSLSRTAKGGIRRSLFAGSVWMLVVLIALAVLAVLGWQQFFAGFHSLFFADGTWTFAATDPLIRLYPNQFWIDAGIAVAALVLVTLVVVLVCTWPTRRRRYQSRLAQADLIRRRNDWADAA